ncbi:hypothetical protein GIB67_012492 [Kingdonia uniflora]|uniref:SWIM-type domain-containing protein n=1 Tax=Kingdonia uniflora TaxID=39325 RepID=A0A7J7MV86_9MAGN|nr:hypothetical protein GIB67_012492 [Kingdonia uniflora]
MSDDEIYEIFHLVIEYGGEWDEPSQSGHIEEDPIHGYYRVFIETEETPQIVPIPVEESPLRLGYDKPKIKKKKSTRCLEKTSRPLKVLTSKTFNRESLKRKAKTKSQKPKVKKVRVDYLSEEKLDDLTKDYGSEEEFEIKEDVDNVDEEVAKWIREELMRQFENNEFEDLTKDPFFDNVDAEEDYHSNHTSEDGDDVPTMDHIEDHESFADNRDFVMAYSNLYEKEDHEDEEPFLPPQALESMLTIGMEWPNISECSGKNGTLNRNANAIWVAKEIENLIRDASTTKPIQISDIVYRRFGVRVSYYTAWNARNMVMEKIVGSYDKGYALCPELCVEIQKSNPGSIATCSREDGNLKFTDMCISFKAALDGFTKGCRPILGLDGCFLKGKYGGQCLSIISLDTNNGFFPIAVFICRSECQATWMKFLTLVQGQLTLYPSKLTFISDRQKCLVEAVSQVFPHSNHRFCFRHMYKNFNQLYREPDAKTWLEMEPYESWCRSYLDASTKCEHVTNNFSESFNNWIVKIRDEPLKKMVERLNLMQMTLMYERKLKAREWDHNGLVPRAVKRIELLKIYSHHYRLEGFEKDQWLVLNDSGTRWILNLEEHTCTCNVWQITGLPCVHAVKVIDQLKYEWVGYCSHYHRVAAYVATYNQAYTFTLMKQLTREIRPPPLLRPTGRPRTLRRREADEVHGVVR